MNISDMHTKIAENEIKVYLAAANKCAPYIGENGNWYVWNLEAGGHIDTGIKAEGINGSDGAEGYSPQREIDYWTEEDKAEIKGYVDEAILGGAW